MSNLEELADKNKNLDIAREKVASHLNIDLKEPKQEKRIEALSKLYEKYVAGIDLNGLLYNEIIEDATRLIEIYKDKQNQLNDLCSSNETFSALKVRLENINYKYKGEVDELEKRISVNQRVIYSYESKYIYDEGIDSFNRKRIKELSDKCWDNWLRALDVKKEWCNTVIGFENRKALLAISKAYIDYHILVNAEISKCFDELRKDKKEGIREYYDILSKYQLPIEKRMDFKVFLQKMIESRFSDAMEIKTILGDFADLQRKQIDDLVEEVKEQYRRDKKDIYTVINHYKQFLLNKQVLFTNESEQLVIYFKKRYIEKIDLLCSRFQMHNAEITAENRKFTKEKLDLIRKIMTEEFDIRLNNLKIEYSKKFIPLIDNFWNMEQITETSYALDEEKLNQKLKEIKIAKNLGLKGLIADFEAERDKLRQYFDKKVELVMNVSKLGVGDFDFYLKDLKEECELLCCEIVHMNARFWSKANARFNCEARKYLIKLRDQYAPYVQSWRADSKPWINEYLITNLNQELLKAVAEALRGLSPEAALYEKASKALFKFNEKTRAVLVVRDKIETEQLMLLNTLPKVNLESVIELSNIKLAELKEWCDEYWTNYNNFYNSLLVGQDEIKN
ncbi:hypothetical protein [Candidatus Mycoplasma haematohominis]|uniref:hypothetical protein n=1 Tax=Candidatus Mycoplasma haematohominis TaxID=1494318 RepID=UPI001C0A6D6B|nr:hypothetical protein [Candidatus Mycoplasma haemohominis]